MWDPLTGKQVRVLRGHRKPVSAVCQVEAGGPALLASSSLDGTLRLWNPANGKHIRTLQGNEHPPEELCTVGAGPDSILASADYREIRLWDPANGNHIRTLVGCSAGITALCEVKVDGLSLLASGESIVDQVEIMRGEVDEEAAGCAVRLWDPTSGIQISILEGHSDAVTAICSFSIGNRDLLASASLDGTVRVWTPDSRTSNLTIPVNYAATSITWVDDSLVIGLDGGVLAIKLTAFQDRYVRPGW